MINDLSVRPKAQNKRADRIFYTLLLVAFAFVFASSMAERYRGVISLGAVISIVVALVIYNRYMSGQYSYEVMASSVDTPLFIVRRTVGKKATTLFNAELRTMVSVDVIAEGDGAGISRECRSYNFCPTLGAVRRARITFKTRYEKTVVLIEGSDEFFSTLSQYAAEARELFGDEE